MCFSHICSDWCNSPRSSSTFWYRKQNRCLDHSKAPEPNSEYPPWLSGKLQSEKTLHFKPFLPQCHRWRKFLNFWMDFWSLFKQLTLFFKWLGLLVVVKLMIIILSVHFICVYAQQSHRAENKIAMNDVTIILLQVTAVTKLSERVKVTGFVRTFERTHG